MNAINIASPETATRTVGHWIGGRHVAGHGRTQEVFNPATGVVARHVALASTAEVEQAIHAARQAFPQWADTPPVRRARVLQKFLALLNQHHDRLAAIITDEH